MAVDRDLTKNVFTTAIVDGHIIVTMIVAVVFSALVIMTLMNIAFYWAMRIRLMRMDSARDRIEWLSLRGGDDVLETYEALFPQSLLPRFCRFLFWTVIFCGAAVLCLILLRRR